MTGAVLAVFALSLQVGSGQRGGPPGGDPTAQILRGAIDIHVHSFPDTQERELDGLEAAMMAHAHGMRGLVLKNHYDQTAGLVYMVRKLVPDLEVFGGIDLNLTVGGMNPAAVEHMAELSGGFGRIVWMSTYDAENQIRFSKSNKRFVQVSKDGALLPATKEIIALVAKHKLILATGHASPQEGLMMLTEGKRLGIQHMVVTHAMQSPVLMDVPQMQDAVKLGALIEFCGGNLNGSTAKDKLDKFADALRKIGVENAIMSTDLGVKGSPLPTIGLVQFVNAMRARGFTAQETDRMTKENPGKLLGLPPLAAPSH